MTSGYDPYDFVRKREQREYEWEQSRPVCDGCGDRILGESVYKIGDMAFCEDCVITALNVVQKKLVELVAEKYRHHRDGRLIINCVETMLDTYDFGDYMREIEEVLP